MTMGIYIINIVERLHSIGYIHCDIKPDNILVGNFYHDPKQINELYLIDFGIT